jgi:hypothetical protein
MTFDLTCYFRDGAGRHVWRSLVVWMEEEKMRDEEGKGFGGVSQSHFGTILDPHKDFFQKFKFSSDPHVYRHYHTMSYMIIRRVQNINKAVSIHVTTDSY